MSNKGASKKEIEEPLIIASNWLNVQDLRSTIEFEKILNRRHLWKRGIEKNICRRCGLIGTDRQIKRGCLPKCLTPSKKVPFSEAPALLKNH